MKEFLITALLPILSTAIPFARFASIAGYDKFRCVNPEFSNFDLSNLAGNWYQTNATWGTNVFGCVWMQIRDTDKNKATLDAHWTVMDAYWNPLDKGSRSHTYSV